VAAAPPTVGAAVRAGAAQLAECSATPRLDAELLLGRVLGVGRERLVIDRARPLAAPQAVRFDALVERRAAHEPVAYILGRRAFRRLELSVDRRVLIPRPETELLVEVGLQFAAGSSVLDVGTGSGAVALALADERPDLEVRGVDVSVDAVAVARENAARLGLDVSFRVGDLVEGCAPADHVLANLPYVADRAPLPADVVGWEPGGALFAGPDGLAVIRRLVGAVAVRRWPRLLALEIGSEQGAAVAQLVRRAGFAQVEVRRDLAGSERVVVGRR